MHSFPRSIGLSVFSRYLPAALACLVLAQVNGAPTISRQPLGATVGLGGDLNLSVEASGNSPLRFQWYRNGFPLSGENSPAFWLRDATAEAAGEYHVVVTDQTGSAKSVVALVETGYPQAIAWRESQLTARRSFHDQVGRVYFLYNLGEPYANTLGGRLTPRLVRLHEATGAIDETFLWRDQLGVPTTLAVRTDHGLYVAVMLGENEGGTVIKVDANGVRDPAFSAPRFDRMIRHLTLQADGKILVSFDSSSASSFLAADLVVTASRALYRLNTDGSIDADFAPLEIGPAVTTLSPPQVDAAGRIYLHLNPALVQGVETRGIFRLNSTGQIDASFPDWSTLPSGVNSRIASMLAQQDGAVVLAGQFSVIKSPALTPSPVVAIRFTPDGVFDATFDHPELYDAFPNAHQQGYPRTITADGEGGFALVGNGFARFSANGTVLARQSVDPWTGFILSRSPTTGRFFVPGVVANDASAGVLVIEPSGTIFTGFAPGQLGRTSDVTSAVALDDGRVLVGGSIDRSGSGRRPGVVLLDRDARVSSGTTPFHDPQRTLYSATTSVMKWPDGNFLIHTSGNQTPGGSGVWEIARFLPDGQRDTVWDGSTGLGIEPGPSETYFVRSGLSVNNSYAVATSGGASLLQRYTVGGELDASFQAELPELCRFTPIGSNEYEVEMGVMLCVRTTVDGGAFVAMATYSGEVRVVKLRADGSRDPAFTSPVLAAVPRSPGSWNFNVFFGQSSPRASVRASRSYSRPIDLVALPDGSIFVTGLFTPAGRPTGIARLNPDGSYSEGFTGSGLGLQRPGLLPMGTRLALDAAGRVYLAGRFDSVNGHPAPGLARFLADGTLDRNWSPGVEVYDDLLERPALVAHGEWLHVFGDVRNPGRPHTAGYLRVLLDPVAPNILASPVSITTNDGSPVTFTVAVQGTAPFTYQWYRGSTPLPGASAPTLVLSEARASDAGDYSVVVSNAAGSATSTGATLAISMPQSQVITFGALPDVAFTGVPLTLRATSTSGLPVEFEVVSGAASVAGNQLTLRGVGSVSIRAIQPGDATYLAATPIAHSFNVRPNFLSWQTEQFTVDEITAGSLTAAEADYDGDGLSNLLEYALGGDPKTADHANAPEIVSSAQEWTFTYTRPADRGDLNYLVEISTDLTSWATGGVTHERVSAGDTETWRARVPYSAGGTIFFRLRVER